MLTSIEGVYRNGRVELSENPGDVPEGTWVIVTFVRTGELSLEALGINREQAEILRANLAAFSEDSDSPSMNIYDDYDAAKANR